MATDEPVTPMTTPTAAAAPSPASPQPPAFCLKCDYPLAPVDGDTIGLCPECGRAFDLKDPRSFSPAPGHVRRWRWLRRGAVAMCLIALAIALAPRGYVVCTLTLTSPTGLNRTIERTELIAPGWLGGITYFGWTGDRDTSTGAAVRTRPTSFSFSLAAKKRWFNWNGGSHSGGALTASGGTSGRQATSVNGKVVTLKSAPDVAAAIARNIASTDSFGVSVGAATSIDLDESP